MSESIAVMSDWEDTGFLGNRLLLRQFKQGHKAGTDAVLLAAFAEAVAGETLIDAGAGIGAAGLALLARSPGAHAVFVERDPHTVALARHNVTANGFAGCATVVEGDIFDHVFCRLAALIGSADLVISNPPFFAAGTVRASHQRRRAEAYVLDHGTHADWLLQTASFLKPKGRLVMIHRPDALTSLLSVVTPRFGGVRLLPVHAREGQAAVRVLVSMRHGSRAPLSLLPPLVLHGSDGSFMPQAEQLHRGVAGLNFP